MHQFSKNKSKIEKRTIRDAPDDAKGISDLNFLPFSFKIILVRGQSVSHTVTTQPANHEECVVRGHCENTIRM